MDIIVELVEPDTAESAVLDAVAGEPGVVDPVEPGIEAPGIEAPEPKRRGRPKGAANKAKVVEPVIEPMAIETVGPVVMEAPRARAKRATRAASAMAPPTATPTDAPATTAAPSFDDLLGHLGRMLAEQKNARTQTRREMYKSFLE